MDVRSKLRSLALLVLAGCSVGEVPIGGEATTTGPDAAVATGGGGEASFDTMVKPLVGRCTGCHGGSTAPNLTSFAALEAKYKMKPGSTNVLVTKGDHQGVTYFTDGEKATLASWIEGL